MYSKASKWSSVRNARVNEIHTKSLKVLHYATVATMLSYKYIILLQHNIHMFTAGCNMGGVIVVVFVIVVIVIHVL